MHPDATNQGTADLDSLRPTDAGVGRQVPEPGRSVLEQAFPPLDIPAGPPQRRLTRRGALGRFLGLGAATVAAAALPEPVQAATGLPDWWPADPELATALERLARVVPLARELPGPVTHAGWLHLEADLLEERAGLRPARPWQPAPAPAPMPMPMPDWLADCPEWMRPLLEDLAVGAHRVHPEQIEEARFFTGVPIAGMKEDAVFTRSRAANEAGLAEGRRRIAEAVAARRADPAPPKVTRVADERVATIRFGRLDPNARRRARRWVAQQPVGPQYPVIRLRLGRRSWPDQADADFLDVARPERSHQGDPATDWAQTVFEDFRRAVGRTRGAAYPTIGAWMMLCSHHGVHNDLYVQADGRPLG